MENQHFKGCDHKQNSLWYGPYTVLAWIGESVYHLDLPTHLGIHDVLNVSKLKLFDLPLEDAITIQHPLNNILDFQPPLLHDKDIKTRNAQ
jgi:hypothetical protein